MCHQYVSSICVINICYRFNFMSRNDYLYLLSIYQEENDNDDDILIKIQKLSTNTSGILLPANGIVIPPDGFINVNDCGESLISFTSL